MQEKIFFKGVKIKDYILGKINKIIFFRGNVGILVRVDVGIDPYLTDFFIIDIIETGDDYENLQ